MRDRLLRALVALAFGLPTPVIAQSLLYEIRGGVLMTDRSMALATTRTASANAEAAFTPSLSLFGRAIRPVLGGTFTTDQGGKLGYLDARWEWAGPLLFVGLGVGASSTG